MTPSDEVDQPTPEPTPERDLGGRPSKYAPEFCDRVIEWGAAGKSRTWMAAKIGVHRHTLENWEKQYPEFLDALSRAKALEQMWWEDAGQDGMTADKFNNGVWSRSMAARFPDEWRETSNSHVTGTMQVTEIKRTIVDPRNSDA